MNKLILPSQWFGTSEVRIQDQNLSKCTYIETEQLHLGL